MRQSCPTLQNLENSGSEPWRRIILKYTGTGLDLQTRLTRAPLGLARRVLFRMPDVGFHKGRLHLPQGLPADAQAFLKPSLSQKILGCGAQLWLHLHASLEDVSSRY